MNVSSLLLKAVKDYKNNPQFIVPRLLEYILEFGIFIGLFMVTAVVLGVMLGGFSYEQLLRPFPGIPFAGVAAVLGAASTAVFLLMVVASASRGAVVTMALNTHKKGTTSLLEGWKGVRRYTLRIFLYLAFLLGGLTAVGVLFSLIVTLLLRWGSVAAPFLALILLVVVIAGGLSVYILTMFTPQMIAAGKAGVAEGLKDSVLFVRSNLGAVAAYSGAVFALTVAVGFVIAAAFFIINEITRYNPFLNLTAKIFRSILAFAMGVLISPYFEIVKTYMVLESIPHKEEENDGSS